MSKKKKADKKKTSNTPSVFKTFGKAAMAERKTILKFWFSFAAIMLLFYVIAIQPFFVHNIQEPVGVFFAYLSSAFLNLLGQNTFSNGMYISSDDYSLLIQKGCDAIAPIMLVVTGILLYPAKRKKKLIGIGTGILTLLILNLIRIISLYFIGVHAPEYFEFMHVEFWQVVFIGLAILYFFYWLNWVSKEEISD